MIKEDLEAVGLVKREGNEKKLGFNLNLGMKKEDFSGLGGDKEG